MSELLIFAEVPRFYAEIELLADPGRRGRPLLVGGDPRKKGRVQSASLEALEAGVEPGMSMLESLERCPRARTVRTNMRRYREVSTRLRAFFRGSAERVELVGLGAAFLEVSGDELDAREMARKIVEGVARELSLPARVGIAPVKFAARLAAEEAPDGELHAISANGLRGFLDPLPVSRLPGVGPRTEARLAEISVLTVADAAACAPARLSSALGKHGLAIHRTAQGLDRDRIRAAPHARSVSQEFTLVTPELDLGVLQERIAELAQGVAQGLRLEALRARRLSLKVAYLDGETVTRTRTVVPEVWEMPDLREVAEELLERTDAGNRALRLVGLAATELSRAAAEDRQLPLFE